MRQGFLDKNIKKRINEASKAVAEGDFQRAIEQFTDLIHIQPGLNELYSILCDLYIKVGRTDLPKEWIIKAVRYDPSFNKSFINLASALYSDGRNREALGILSALVEGSPSNYEAWNDLGVVQVSLNGIAVAEQSFKQALALNRHYGEAIRNLTFLYFSTGRYELARKTSQLLFEEDCNAPAEIFRAVGDLIKGVDPVYARRFFERADKIGGVSVNPVSPRSEIGQKAEEIFAPDLNNKAVVWYSTMKCNNRCPYCLAFQVNDPMIKVPFRDYREWVDVWNSFEGNLILDITGGEPFLLPNFIEMILAFNDNIKVAITTNLRCDLTHFVQKIPPERIISITCSLHPSQGMNVEYFIGKILLLKNRGFPVSVNYVAYPEQLWLIPYFKEIIESVGIRFHVDPYGPGPKRPYVLSEREKDFLQQFVGMDRSDFFNKEPVLYRCSGGMNFFSILPNGDTYTCVTKRYVKENYVGNVFEEGFKPFDEPIKCRTVSCAGCDVDKVTRVKI